MRLFPFFYLLLSSFLFSATSQSSCKILLDIGHTPQKSGAVSAYGIGEYQYNKRSSIELFYYLKEAGVDVEFVNSDEKDIPLRERTKEAIEKKGDLFISIHHDSVKSQFLSKWKYNKQTYQYCDTFEGHGIFVSKKNPYFKKSLSLATSIGKALCDKKFIHSTYHTKNIKGERKKFINSDLGIYQYDNLVVLKGKIPAILIEMDFIVNRNSLERMEDEEYRNEKTEAIVEGIKRYCKELR